MKTPVRHFRQPPSPLPEGAGVSACWKCRGGLHWDTRHGAFIFATVLDPDNNELRVHKTCLDDSIGDGYREKR